MENQKRSKHAAIGSWLGCCAVAVSLVVAGRASAVVTVGVATNNGVPGGTLTLTMSISRETTDSSVASANVDVIFDTTQLQLTGACSDAGAAACQVNADCTAPAICVFSPGPCQIDPRLTKQTFNVFVPDFQNVPVGRRRLRLAILDTEPPVDTFTDGILGTCTFQVLSGAAAGPLTLYAGACSNSGTACLDATQCPASEFCVVRFNVGDEHGQTIPNAKVQVVPGVIVAATPTPTGPTVTPTDTPSPTPTPTSSPTITPSPSVTVTSITATPTITRTATVTMVEMTATPTLTRTSTAGTPSPTVTLTTATNTPTKTVPGGSPTPTRTTTAGGGGGKTDTDGCNTIGGSQTGVSGSLAWLAVPVALLVRRRLRG